MLKKFILFISVLFITSCAITIKPGLYIEVEPQTGSDFGSVGIGFTSVPYKFKINNLTAIPIDLYTDLQEEGEFFKYSGSLGFPGENGTCTDKLPSLGSCIVRN